MSYTYTTSVVYVLHLHNKCSACRTLTQQLQYMSYAHTARAVRAVRSPQKRLAWKYMHCIGITVAEIIFLRQHCSIYEYEIFSLIINIIFCQPKFKGEGEARMLATCSLGSAHAYIHTYIQYPEQASILFILQEQILFLPCMHLLQSTSQDNII